MDPIDSRIEVPLRDFLCPDCQARPRERTKDNYKYLVSDEKTAAGATVKIVISNLSFTQTGPGRYGASFQFDVPPSCPGCDAGVIEYARIGRQILEKLFQAQVCHLGPLEEVQIDLTDPRNDAPTVHVRGSYICRQCAVS